MKEVSVQQLKQMKDAGENFQLIDVREPWEIEICSLDGESIPMGELLTRIGEIKEDIPVIIHCRSGGRSANVVNALEMQKGMTNLHNLAGGILAWADEIDQTMEKY